MKKIKCKVIYRSYGSKFFITFCKLVSNGIYNNPLVFLSPTVHADDFNSTLTKFSDAYGKYKNAPKIEKTNLTNAHNDMLAIVDKIKDYVDIVADGDASIIILAAFTPTKSTTKKSKPVEVTNDFDVTRTNILGQAEVTINYAGKGEPMWYFAICSTDATFPSTLVKDGVLTFNALPDAVSIDISKAKKKLFTNLISGTTYYFYALVGNTKNVSLVSNPKSLTVY